MSVSFFHEVLTHGFHEIIHGPGSFALNGKSVSLSIRREVGAIKTIISYRFSERGHVVLNAECFGEIVCHVPTPKLDRGPVLPFAIGSLETAVDRTAQREQPFRPLSAKRSAHKRLKAVKPVSVRINEISTEKKSVTRKSGKEIPARFAQQGEHRNNSSDWLNEDIIHAAHRNHKTLCAERYNN
jgi:hypothetical protein